MGSSILYTLTLFFTTWVWKFTYKLANFILIHFLQISHYKNFFIINKNKDKYIELNKNLKKKNQNSKEATALTTSMYFPFCQ